MRLTSDILIALGLFAAFGAMIAVNFWAHWRSRPLQTDKHLEQFQQALPDAAVRAGLAVVLVGVGLLVRFWT